MTSNFDRFGTTIRNSDVNGRDAQLLMDSRDEVKIYYAPFDYINKRAKVVIVGITPGPTQMENAIVEARKNLLAGRATIETLQLAKREASFSGRPFRSNLCRQLDHWGMQDWLGIGKSADLFGSAESMVQTTSLLRYPVFVDNKPYNGTPNMLKHPLLREYLMTYFVCETQDMENAIFVSLGPVVAKVLERLANDGHIDRSRIANGLLHGSGENTYRIDYLSGDRTGKEVPHRTNPIPYDKGRTAFRRDFLGR